MNARRFWFNLRTSRPFLAHTLLTAACNILIAGLGVVSGVIAARLLGPQGRGELSAIQTTPSFIAALAMIGMPEATAYFSACSPSEAGSYLTSAITIALVSSLPFMCIAYSVMPVLLKAQSPGIIYASRWYILVTPLYALVGMLRYPFQGRSDFAAWNMMRIAPNALWVGVLCLAWATAHAEPDFLAMGSLVVLAMLFFPFSILVARRIPGSFVPEPRKWLAMLRYGLPCMLTSVPQTLNLRLDQILMAALLPPRDLGLYVAAVAWSAAPGPLLTALGDVTLPAVVSASTEGHGQRRLISRVRTTASVAVLLCGALTLVTPIAINILFGNRFAESISAALILVPATGVLGVNLVLQEGLRAMGHPYASLQAELIGLIVTGIALTTMLGPMGILGAAIASLLGYCTVTVVLLLKARVCAGTSVRLLLMPRPQDLLNGLATLASLTRESKTPIT